MLEKIKSIPKRATSWIRGDSNCNAGRVLEMLSESLGRELNIRLKDLSKFTDALLVIKAQHLAINNLTNTKAAVDQVLRLKMLVNAEIALSLLDEQTKQTEKILQTAIVANSSTATEIGSRVLNLLFCAKQAVQRKFLFIPPIESAEDYSRESVLTSAAEPELLTGVNHKDVPSVSRLFVPATLLYQLHYSLFPAERMMVGAGKRSGQNISIDAVFDVTGDASAGYVRANANLLGRALMAMSETETYFALWIHSHPGRGKEASRPSGIDRNQEVDWLRDYSSDLVNAIMVEDRFVRFWGMALEEDRITVEITGAGIKKDAENENIFRLES
jgi:hypothetical protein